jgi:hypothetical protein
MEHDDISFTDYLDTPAQLIDCYLLIKIARQRIP